MTDIIERLNDPARRLDAIQDAVAVIRDYRQMYQPIRQYLDEQTAKNDLDAVVLFQCVCLALDEGRHV